MGLWHKQGVRAFFSFDLAGSSALKSSTDIVFPQGTRHDGSPLEPKWLPFFRSFFRIIPERIRSVLDEEVRRNGDITPFLLEVWRITGDEVLFVSSRLRDPSQLALIARVVYSVLHDLDILLSNDPLSGPSKKLGLKGVMWAAGFPIRNIEFGVYPQSSRVVRFKSRVPFTLEERRLRTIPDLDHEPQDDSGYAMQEFLGPEIDLGFRLGSLAVPRRLLVSIDVAEILARNVGRFQRTLRPTFHHVGWAPLKGLYGGTPYPLIWLDYGREYREPRTSFEAAQSDYLLRYHAEESAIPADELIALAESYLADTSDSRIQMYIDPNPDPTHADLYRQEKRNRK